jgi:hypothetical protein
MGKQKYFTEEERLEIKRKRQKIYYQTHKEKAKKYYIINKEKILKQSKIYKENHKNEYKKYYLNHKEEIKEKSKKYGKNHRKERNIYQNKYRNIKLKTDINFKLAHYLRCRLRSAIQFNQKSGFIIKDLGCSIPELKLYLESKFQEGMSWDNYGYWGWHIDHIIPLASFNLSNREEFLKVCHYTNLQPLWGKENLKKGKT